MRLKKRKYVDKNVSIIIFFLQHVYELQKQNLNTGQGLHNDWLGILMYV